MTDTQKTGTQTVWVPGLAGWQGQQRSTTGLIALGVVLAAAILFYAATLLADPAPAMKVLGAAVVVAVGIAVWLQAAHVRVARVRVVRLVVDGTSVVFGGAEQIIWPLRTLVLAGLLLLAGWAWSVFTVPAERMTMLTLLGVPVIGAILLIAGARSWFRPPSRHRLSMRPDGLELRIPRNDVSATWDEIEDASLEGDRVVVRTTTTRPSSWAARDLASDPVILAELVSFYARHPAARAEIGAATLARLRSGDL
ncbi:hypothetical protein [Microbacterium sp. WCS2018Hpa-23]|uniref:hypothetical protein n=1 Tax=Microbacterium sp. WCS2018Hpa-23 TaxID=3073634 RepID=UPI002882E021|nr:hypothetical protein [Microbacterium sp. WCS2018Hpa-23]